MKLIGSRTEIEYREQLIGSSENLLASKSTLKNVVFAEFPNLKTLILLSWLPGDTYDIYLILVDGSKILNIELEKDNSEEPIIEHWELSEYLHNISKQNHIQLLVAQELHKEIIVK